MSNIVTIENIRPIPSREVWNNWLSDLNRPGVKFLSGHFIREESAMFTKVREVKIAKVVTEEVSGHRVMGYLMRLARKAA